MRDNRLDRTNPLWPQARATSLDGPVVKREYVKKEKIKTEKVKKVKLTKEELNRQDAKKVSGGIGKKGTS